MLRNMTCDPHFLTCTLCRVCMASLRCSMRVVVCHLTDNAPGGLLPFMMTPGAYDAQRSTCVAIRPWKIT